MNAMDWKSIIFDELSKNPLADRILVFGSAANPAADPKDIDIYVEAHPQTDGEALQDLLRLAHRFYGCLDPFFLHNGVLFVRSKEATHWVRARCGAAIALAGQGGLPLSDALELAVGADLTGMKR